MADISNTPDFSKSGSDVQLQLIGLQFNLDLNKLESKIINDLSEKINNLSNEVKDRVQDNTIQLVKVEEKISNLEKRLDKLEVSLSTIQTTINRSIIGGIIAILGMAITYYFKP
jgi:chromosome segregation ATPase